MANIYTIYADHKDNITAQEFVSKMRLFLDKLVDHKKMNTYRITRMKLGFRSMDLPEFHIMMEFNNMQQLDDAMTSVLRNEKSIDEKHIHFNQLVNKDTIQHFLYRDFPDTVTMQKTPDTNKKFSTKDLVEATKNILPDAWE